MPRLNGDIAFEIFCCLDNLDDVRSFASTCTIARGAWRDKGDLIVLSIIHEEEHHKHDRLVYRSMADGSWDQQKFATWAWKHWHYLGRLYDLYCGKKPLPVMRSLKTFQLSIDGYTASKRERFHSALMSHWRTIQELEDGTDWSPRRGVPLLEALGELEVRDFVWGYALSQRFGDKPCWEVRNETQNQRCDYWVAEAGWRHLSPRDVLELLYTPGDPFNSDVFATPRGEFILSKRSTYLDRGWTWLSDSAVKKELEDSPGSMMVEEDWYCLRNKHWKCVQGKVLSLSDSELFDTLNDMLAADVGSEFHDPLPQLQEWFFNMQAGDLG